MSPPASQRITVVTGASRGIGAAVARACAAAGDKVVAIARSQKALEALDDAVQAGGGDPVTLVPLDLKDYDGLDRLAGALFERFGRIDALAACAGVLGALTPLHQATPKMMEETLAANLIANARLIRAFHPLLQASPAGRAVFLTSSVASRPRAYWGAYAASKAGLEALARTWADELGVTAVKANVFNPGPTRTAMRARAYPGEDPMTLPSPEEVAAQITPLLQAAWTDNGATIGFVRPAG